MKFLKLLFISIFLIWFQPSFSQLNADFEPDTTTIVYCHGGVINFTDNSTGNPTSWAWDFGDFTSSADQNPTHLYDWPGVYDVTLIVHDGTNADTMVRLFLIHVYSNPEADFIPISFSFSPLTFSFYNLSQNTTSYLWDFGDQQTSSAYQPTHTYAADGNYSICLRVFADSCSDTYCDSVNVTSNCSSYFDLYPDTVLHHYYAINMTAGISPINYSWDWGDGSIDTVAFPSHTYDTAGTYTICLSIDDANHCTDTFCLSYSFLKTSNEIIEVTVIPPLGTGIIHHSDSEPLLVFPNPATDYLMVELPELISKTDLKIFNTLGRLLLSSEITNQNNRIDISELSSGIHILELRTNNSISRQKFIKQ